MGWKKMKISIIKVYLFFQLLGFILYATCSIRKEYEKHANIIILMSLILMSLIVFTDIEKTKLFIFTVLIIMVSYVCLIMFI